MRLKRQVRPGCEGLQSQAERLELLHQRIVAPEGSSHEGAERDQLFRICTVIRPTLFLAKDSGQVFKPLEWAVRASGMRSPVQGPGCGGSAGRGRRGGAMERKGRARFPSLTNYSLVGEVREPHHS